MNIATTSSPPTPTAIKPTPPPPLSFSLLSSTLTAKKKSKKNYRPRLSGGRMNDPIYVNAYMNVTQVFPLIRR